MIGLIDPAYWPERLLIICMALLFDAVIGDAPLLFRFVPHPIILLGRTIAALELRLNRPTRGRHDRRLRGVFLLSLLGAAALGFGWVLSLPAASWRYGWVLEILAVCVLVAQKSLYLHVARVAHALRIQGLQAGRNAVRHIVGRDPQSLDQAGVARAAIESLAENLSDGVVGPVLAYACLGLPGILLYKTVNTLDSMIGHRNARYRDFGWASARFDDLLNLAPARLCGVLLVAASAFIPTAKPGRAWRVMLRDAPKHRSPNAGWPEAAMAGALDLKLAGPRRYGNVTADDAWLGDGRPEATAQDIERALTVYVVACLIQLGICAMLAWWRLAGTTGSGL